MKNLNAQGQEVREAVSAVRKSLRESRDSALVAIATIIGAVVFRENEAVNVGFSALAGASTVFTAFKMGETRARLQIAEEKVKIVGQQLGIGSDRSAD